MLNTQPIDPSHESANEKKRNENEEAKLKRKKKMQFNDYQLHLYHLQLDTLYRHFHSNLLLSSSSCHPCCSLLFITLISHIFMFSFVGSAENVFKVIREEKKRKTEKSMFCFQISGHLFFCARKQDDDDDDDHSRRA